MYYAGTKKSSFFLARIIAVLMLLLNTSCPGDIKALLREYGYTPVKPASSLWRPGSVVYLKSRRPLEVGFICTASQVMGSDYAPLQSTTNNADIARATKKGLNLGLNVQELATVDGEFDDIRSASLSIRNAREYVVTDLDVAAAASRMNKRCLSAIARRRAQGYDVTFISGAIEGDVSVQIQYRRSSKLDAQAKIAAAQNLGAKLGVDASAVSDKNIQATSLIWGIRVDDFLASVLAPEILPPADRGSKIFDPAAVADIEAFVAGTEPRSMPTTPLSEQQPVMWAPIPPLTPPPAAKVDETELAATVSGDPCQIVAAPPSPVAAPVDVPPVPEDAFKPDTDVPDDDYPVELTPERLEELRQLYGDDWDGEND